MPATAYTPTTTQPITNYIPTLLTAPAGVARFDHNPITGESLGLLVEEQRTNLLTRSEEFDNAAWGKANATVTANAVVAPDGTLTGDKLVDNTTNGFHRISQTPAVVSGTSYTFSVYLKAAEITRVTLQIGSAFFPQTLTNFNLSSGTVASGTGTITAVGNGWYRCSNTATATGTGAGEFFIELTDASGNRQYTGNGWNGVFLWGCQLEAASFPTSYIPTVAATVTRNADVASMTGVNFSSWYRADVSTMYCMFSVPQIGRSARLFAVDSGVVDNMFDATVSVINGVALEGVSGGVYGGFVGAGGIITANTAQKVAVSFSTSENELITLNGSTVQSGSVTNPAATITTLRIGYQANFSAILNGHIRRIAYYPTRLTNEQLQALTR